MALRICTSSKFPGEADTAGLGTDFEKDSFRTTAWSLVINKMKSTHNQREPVRESSRRNMGAEKPEGSGRQQPENWHLPPPERGDG